MTNKIEDKARNLNDATILFIKELMKYECLIKDTDDLYLVHRLEQLKKKCSVMVDAHMELMEEVDNNHC